MNVSQATPEHLLSAGRCLRLKKGFHCQESHDLAAHNSRYSDTAPTRGMYCLWRHPKPLPRRRHRVQTGQSLARLYISLYSSKQPIPMTTPGIVEVLRTNANPRVWDCIDAFIVPIIRRSQTGSGIMPGIMPGGAMRMLCLVSTMRPLMAAPRLQTRRGKPNALELTLSFPLALRMPLSAEFSTAIGTSMQ